MYVIRNVNMFQCTIAKGYSTQVHEFNTILDVSEIHTHICM